MNLADAPIPAPMSWAKSELQTRAEQMVDEQPRHGLQNLREALLARVPATLITTSTKAFEGVGRMAMIHAHETWTIRVSGAQAAISGALEAHGLDLDQAISERRPFIPLG